MRQRLLQGEALLEDVALHDALEQLGRQLPARLRPRTREADQGGFARLMVLDDFPDPAAVIVEGIAVSRQHGLDLETANAFQRSEVVVQGVRTRLWMETDVQADLRQQMIAREQHTACRPVETAVAG